MENKCPLCNKINPPSEWLCEACGAKLPMHGQKSDTVTPRVAPVASKPAMTAAPVSVPASASPPLTTGAKGILWGCGALFFFVVVMPVSCSVVSSITKPAPTPTPFPTAIPTASAPIDPCKYASAICRDNTTSQATGSGACSRHGGVARWCR